MGRFFVLVSLFAFSPSLRAEAILDKIRSAYFSEINSESGRAAFFAHSQKVLSALSNESYLFDALNSDGDSELMIVKLEGTMTIEEDRYVIRDVYLLNHFFRVNALAVESHEGVLSVMAAFIEGNVNDASQERVRLRFDGFRTLQ